MSESTTARAREFWISWSQCIVGWMAVQRITLVKFGVCTMEVAYHSSIYLDGVCLRRFSGFLY